MMQKTPFPILHFLVPPTTELSHFLVDNNQLVIANGINLSYKKGVVIKDTGYSKVGAVTLQSGKAITGLFNFRQSSSVQKMLATVNNSNDTALQLMYWNGSAWAELTDAETAWSGFEDAQVEMESFIGYCFFAGYDSTDGVFLPLASLTGTTFSTSTCVTGMPQSKYIKRYRDRVYVANCYLSAVAYPYRVYFSSVPAGGAITWTTGTDFFDVDYSEQITGIAENWDKLIIFTEFSAYFYNQEEKKKVWDLGCSNSKTIRNYEAYLFFANKDNVWVSTGGRPVPVGNDILELIRNSTTANWSAEIIDREYNLFLGNTSANGISYTNCLATYNIETGIWRWRELYDNIKTLGKYTSNNDDFLYMGTTTGDVMVKSKYSDAAPVYSDNTQPITAHFRTKAYDFSDPSTQKKVVKILTFAEDAQGLNLRFSVYNKNQETSREFKDIGSLNKVINEFEKTIAGYFIQFEGKEISKNKSFRFYGLIPILEEETSL